MARHVWNVHVAPQPHGDHRDRCGTGRSDPMPCIPVTPAPWVVGAPRGIIQIIQPGQLTEEVP
ncbi:hypothetical protein [Archangium violaceum]|uniref:hypothetical protein n=1 Tax=Archangium violaceum TaxID=83451 RepID=UPI0037BE8FEC